MANIGFPGTGSFVGELLILIGSMKANTTVTFIGGCYSLWLFNRVSYGNLKTQYISSYLDISKKEFFIFVPLILGTIVMGVCPTIFLDSIHFSVNRLVEEMNI